jgi:hypothetical protein
MLKPASNPNTLMGATQPFPGAASAPVNPDAGKVKTVQMDPNQTKGQTITSEDFGDPKNDDIIAVDKQRAPSNFTGADGVETTFGTLNSGDADYPIPATEKNILVFVENVFQIPGTNYTLVQNPPAKAAGWYIQFGTAVPFGKDVTVLHNFDK